MNDNSHKQLRDEIGGHKGKKTHQKKGGYHEDRPREEFRPKGGYDDYYGDEAYYDETDPYGEETAKREKPHIYRKKD